MTKKAFVFIDFDMSIRHFIHSGTFKELEHEYEVTYVFHADSTSDKKGIHCDWNALDLNHKLTLEIPRARMGAWDRLFCITMLHNQRGSENYTPIKTMLSNNARGKFRVNLYALAALPVVFQIVRKALLQKLSVHQGMLDFLNIHQPDVVFHPTILAGYYVNDLVIACNKMNIPCSLLMNSWDNPSSKAVLAAVPDALVVWGEQTKRHAIEYMRFPAERVECFGAAQFQIYRQPVTETDKQLREMFSVPQGKKIILYGGASKGAHESTYLKLLDDCISDGRIPDCHVIYRPHPWRGSLGEGEVGFYDLGLKNISMDPHLEDYYRRVTHQQSAAIEMADYRVTRKLLHLVDAVISPLSTILLETIILGKPVLMYFPTKDLEGAAGLHTKISMRLIHFREFWGVEGINICTDEDKFAATATHMMKQVGDPEVTKTLLEHAGKYVEMDGPTYGERLVKLADKLTAPGRRPSHKRGK